MKRNQFLVIASLALALSFVVRSARADEATLRFKEFLSTHKNATNYEACENLRANYLGAPEMFENGNATELPKGDTYGCVIGLEFLSDFPDLNKALSESLNQLWAGKKFSDDGTSLINKVEILGGTTATAAVSITRDPGGKDYVLLDYSQSTHNFPIEETAVKILRDEVREVAPGIFLGPLLLDLSGLTGANTLFQTTLYFAVFTPKSQMFSITP